MLQCDLSVTPDLAPKNYYNFLTEKGRKFSFNEAVEAWFAEQHIFLKDRTILIQIKPDRLATIISTSHFKNKFSFT